MYYPTLTEYFNEAVEQARKRKERGEPEFPTGFDFLDEITDGIHRGEVWIIAGKSGSGKTAFAMQIARSFAENTEHTVLFSSLELKGQELMARMFAEMMNLPYLDFIKGNFPDNFKEDETKFKEYIKNIDFEIAEFVGYQFPELEKAIREGYKDKKPDILFIDFIQMIEKRGFSDERHALENYVRKLKELAKRENIGIVIVSQLRRLPSGSDYNREPEMIDLLGTGSLEQLSDKVILLYSGVDKEGGKKHFIKLAKNRQGETFKKEIIYQGWVYRFKEIPMPVYEEQ